MKQDFMKCKVYGYFIHLTFKYFIYKVEDGMLSGFDISKLGKVQTITIHQDKVDELVWLDI